MVRLFFIDVFLHALRTCNPRSTVDVTFCLCYVLVFLRCAQVWTAQQGYTGGQTGARVQHDCSQNRFLKSTCCKHGEELFLLTNHKKSTSSLFVSFRPRLHELGSKLNRHGSMISKPHQKRRGFEVFICLKTVFQVF